MAAPSWPEMTLHICGLCRFSSGPMRDCWSRTLQGFMPSHASHSAAAYANRSGRLQDSGAAHVGADHSGILQSRHNGTMSRMPWAKGCSACPACGTEMTVPVGRCYLYDLILSCLDHCVRVSLMTSCMWSLRCHTTKTNLQQFARTCRIPINLPHGYQYAKHGNTVSRIGGNHGCNRKAVEPHWKRSSLAVIWIVFIKRPRGESAKDSSPIQLEQKHCHYDH